MGKYRDLTGRKFGRLTIIKPAGMIKGHFMWHCMCDCGKETIVRADLLQKGSTRSCGCLSREIHVQTVHHENLIGYRFSRLIVVEYAGRTKTNRMCLWRCKCDCGNEIIVRTSSLRDGSTRSCGCLQRERVIEAATTHGLSGGRKGTPRLYRIWRNIKQRCLNPKATKYHNYGGRGIAVCAEWMDFKTFYEWAMANGYRDDLTIDRKDVNGDYEPGNCRWATWQEQAVNRRKNRKVE